MGDKEAWLEKVDAFEVGLSALADAAQEKDVRARYHIRFDRHVFANGLKDFSDYQFPCSISFDGANFGKGNISFDGAAFGKGNISFDGAKFGDGSVWFYGATFGDGSVLFNRATFGDGEVSFDGVNFGNGNVSFVNVIFQTTTIAASGVVIAGNLYIKSYFPKAVDFSRLVVKGTARFSGSGFDKVPNFRDAKFDRAPEVAGMVVPRPKLKGWNSLAADRDDVAKLRKLKAMALAANDHEKDGEFFAGEMLAKRGVETTSFNGLLFNTHYWKLSDFGQSFTLPVWWMCRTFLLFAYANESVRSSLSYRLALRARVPPFHRALKQSLFPPSSR